MVRLLLVEDDVDLRSLLLRRLARPPHVVSAVNSAEAALANVESSGLPDLAVLDVGLPRMNGFDLVIALRAYAGGADLPVVFVSAHVLPEHVAAGRALGAAYVTKPFVALELLRTVGEMLTGTRAPLGGTQVRLGPTEAGSFPSMRRAISGMSAPGAGRDQR